MPTRPIEEAWQKSAPRPAPDEPELEATPSGWFAIVKRAAKSMLDDEMPLFASALAYSTFFAIPAVLLVVVGVFSLVADPSTIDRLIQRFSDVMPAQATQLLHDSLLRLSERPSTGVAMTVAGFVLAIWSTTGAMTAYMAAVSRAYERKDGRNFVKKRLTALVMVACMGFAFGLVGVFVLFGPAIEHWIGNALGIEGVLKYVWWSAQWPILVA